MRVLVDENLPRSLAGRLRQAGHDAIDLRERGLAGLSDTEVLALANSESRVLVSGNHKHFANVLLFPPARSCGIVVVRMPKCTIQAVMARIERVLAALREPHVRGSLIIVDPTRVRRRT
jgi:predicted nuclease of predicted toxin-antitoxin system